MKALEQLQALLGLLVLLAVLVLGARRALGRRKRATATSGVFDVIDEVFSPARHSAAVELRAQRHHGPVTPVPDGWQSTSLEGPYVVRRKANAAPADLTSGES